MSARRPAGFTLIELLIVVVIIGILAAIAIPKFGETRERANQAALKSDLRNLLTAQEQYFGDNNVYGDLGQITAATLWNPSAGVTAAISGQTATGFTGTVTKGSAVCSMFYNVSTTDTRNGAPQCN